MSLIFPAESDTGHPGAMAEQEAPETEATVAEEQENKQGKVMYLKI